MPQPTLAEHAAYRYRDYLSWPASGRWELIEGTALAMSPAPSRRHQGVVAQLTACFVNYLADKPCRAYPAPFDVRLPKAGEADDDVDTVVQPDLVVVCDPAKLDDKGCRGAPDLVVEVTSPATASLDHVRKKALYERHGVAEYWIVHPTDQVVLVYRLGEDRTFSAPAAYGANDDLRVGLFEDLVVNLARAFAD